MNSTEVANGWADAFSQRFAEIALQRMQGLPVMNPALQVQALGFAMEHDQDAAPSGVLGILLTPWFMNLIWLPMNRAITLAPGASGSREFHGQALDFIGADDERLGRYESCSLFSPMFEFTDQATACATAEQVLILLRQPPAPAEVQRPAMNRRELLFGRRGGQA